MSNFGAPSTRSAFDAFPRNGHWVQGPFGAPVFQPDDPSQHGTWIPGPFGTSVFKPNSPSQPKPTAYGEIGRTHPSKDAFNFGITPPSLLVNTKSELKPTLEGLPELAFKNIAQRLPIKSRAALRHASKATTLDVDFKKDLKYLEKRIEFLLTLANMLLDQFYIGEGMLDFNVKTWVLLLDVIYGKKDFGDFVLEEDETFEVSKLSIEDFDLITEYMKRLFVEANNRGLDTKTLMNMTCKALASFYFHVIIRESIGVRPVSNKYKEPVTFLRECFNTYVFDLEDEDGSIGMFPSYDMNNVGIYHQRFINVTITIIDVLVVNAPVKIYRTIFYETFSDHVDALFGSELYAFDGYRRVNNYMKGWITHRSEEPYHHGGKVRKRASKRKRTQVKKRKTSKRKRTQAKKKTVKRKRTSKRT